MSYDEIMNIAKELDKKTQQQIDKKVAERMEILKESELTNDELEKMEECLYMSFIVQEFLEGEYDLLEEEKLLLLEDMEDLFEEYQGLLAKAKLEEKLSKKKRMALELMRIRNQLMKHKERMQRVNNKIAENRDSKEKLKNLSDKEKLKEVAKDNKKNKADKSKAATKDEKKLPNPDKQKKFGVVDKDMEPLKNKTNSTKEYGASGSRVSSNSDNKIKNSNAFFNNNSTGSFKDPYEVMNKTTDAVNNVEYLGEGIHKSELVPHL